MKTSIEIEFKSMISEENYNKLIKMFDLEENIFHQVNYYFDSDDFYLKNNHMALRIRNKGTSFKFTMKSPYEGNIREDSIFLDRDEALSYIDNGLNLTELYGIDINANVKACLETYRAITPFKGGKLFIDKAVYCNKTDYEIEYEVDEREEGLKIFRSFLDENNIPYSYEGHKINRCYKAAGLEK